jgi:hypothetical protein
VDWSETTDDAPPGLLWLHLACRHGLAVKIAPGVLPDSTLALVDTRILRMAEAARAEHGDVAWLKSKGPSRDARAEAAKAVLDGKGEPDYDDAEPPETVIEQTMQHHAYIDMGAVKKVAMWAVGVTDAGNADPQHAPDYVPKWARELAMGGYWTEIDEICNWVVGLRKS